MADTNPSGGATVGGTPKQGDSRFNYNDPFFDLASMSLPDDIKSLFRYSKYYFYAEPVVSATVRKMAQYPITDIILQNSNSDKAEEEWEDIKDKLGLKSFLISIGLDYFTYGNAFFTPYLPFIRKAICPRCREEVPDDEVPKSHNLGDIDKIKYKDGSFNGRCPECESGVEFEIREEPKPNVDEINLIRWNPLNIDIDHNTITGKTKYYYNIPNEERNKILQNDPDYLEDVPMEFIKAAHEGKPVKLKSNMIYHLHRETLAQKGRGWGRPLIYPVLKYLYYLQTLRKAQEVVANERAIPFRYLFPSPGGVAGGQSPVANYDMGKWRSKVQNQITQWKEDPGHISLMPFPLEEGNLGGDAKALLLTPEINNVVQQIITGMGVPQEFIYGGMQWTGSSVSLRMIENKMLNYRKHINKVLDFLKNKLTQFLDLPEINIHLQDFKMADDTQRKQLALKLNQAGKISDTTLLNELGYDHDEEIELMSKEIDKKEELMKKQVLSSSRLKGIMGKIQGEYQIEHQRDMQEEKMEMQQEMAQAQQAAQAAAGGGGQGQNPAKAAKDLTKQIEQDSLASRKKLSQLGKQVSGQLDEIIGDGQQGQKEDILSQLKNSQNNDQ